MPGKTTTPSRSLSLACLALVISLSGCGGGGDVDIPAEVLSEDAVAVMYVDAQDITPETLRTTFDFFLQRWPGEIYPRDVGRTIKKLSNTATTFDAMLFVFGPPDKRMGEPPLSLLLRVGSGVSPEEAKKALPVGLIDSGRRGVKLAEFADDWLVLRQTGKREPYQSHYVDPGGASEAVTAWFNRKLNQSGDRPMKFVFRVTHPLERMVGHAAREARGRHKPQVARMLKAAGYIQSGWIAAGLGEQPHLTAQVTCPDPDAAEALGDEFPAVREFFVKQMFTQQSLRENLSGAMELAGSGKTLSVDLTTSELKQILGPANGPSLGELEQRKEKMLAASQQARKLYQAAVEYAETHHEGPGEARLPDHLVQIYQSDQHLPIETFVSPFAQTKIPDGFADWKKERQAKWVVKNASYVLVPGQKNTLNTYEAALFLKPREAVDGKIVLTRKDNSTSRRRVESVDRMLRQQTGKSASQLARASERDRARAQARTDISVDQSSGEVPDSTAALDSTAEPIDSPQRGDQMEDAARQGQEMVDAATDASSDQAQSTNEKTMSPGSVAKAWLQAVMEKQFDRAIAMIPEGALKGDQEAKTRKAMGKLRRLFQSKGGIKKLKTINKFEKGSRSVVVLEAIFNRGESLKIRHLLVKLDGQWRPAQFPQPVKKKNRGNEAAQRSTNDQFSSDKSNKAGARGSTTVKVHAKTPRPIKVAVGKSGGKPSAIIQPGKRGRLRPSGAKRLIASDANSVRVMNKTGDELATLSIEGEVGPSDTLILTESDVEKKKIGSTVILMPGEWSIDIESSAE